MRAQSELGEAFAVLDGERIVFVNRATERLTGRTAEELYALESVFALVAPEHRRAIGGAAARRPPRRRAAASPAS